MHKPVRPARPIDPRRPYGAARPQAVPTRKRYAPFRRIMLWAGTGNSALFWLAYLLARVAQSRQEGSIGVMTLLVTSLFGIACVIMAPLAYAFLPVRTRGDLVGLILSCVGCLSIIAAFVFVAIEVFGG